MIAGAAVSAMSQKAAGENAAAWQQYNAEMEYHNAQVNIKNQTAITEANATALAMQTGMDNSSLLADMDMNSQLIEATTMYNDSLFEQDLVNNWEAAGLDLKLLQQQRMRERGSMEAQQAASGTIMASGSNAQVIVDQKTQEALDAFVINKNADLRANEILNARAKNLYEGEMALRKLEYEGKQVVNRNTTNAKMQLAHMETSQNLANISAETNARMGKSSANSNAEITRGNANAQATNTLAQGLFQGAASGVNSYYADKATGGSGWSLVTGGGGNSGGRTSVSPSKFNPGGGR